MSRGLVAGAFKSGEELLAAVQAARREGLAVHDVYTPYPVHGMDQAMGLAPSHLPRLCFLFGTTGLTLALSFQYWVSLYNWPLNIGGKSFDASPALIPIAFELTVLFAGLGTVASLFVIRRLHPGKKPSFEGMGALDDRFVLALRAGADGPGLDELRKFLESRGAGALREEKPA